MATKTANTKASLQHIRELLDQGRPDQALDFVTRLGNGTPEMANARGVCLLRLGRLDEAIEVLEDITYQGLPGIPHDVPPLFRVNFAAAMLRANRNKEAVLTILDRLNGNEHPEAAKLKAAVRQWKKSIGPLGRFRCRLGLCPAQPVPLDEHAGAV
jgi:sugar phosphate isomerase/epimerase